MFPVLEGVENDGAIDGAVGHMPHPANERAVAFHQVREEFAGLGAGGIDRAKIAFQKNTAVRVALENSAFFGRFRGVFAQELFRLHAEVTGEAVRITFGDRSRGDAAAIGAGGAVDGCFDALSDRLQSPFDEVVTLHPGAKAAVFFALLFAESLDLDKIRGELFRQAAATIIVGRIIGSDGSVVIVTVAASRLEEQPPYPI